MRFDSLPQIEERFRREAAAALKPYALPVTGEDLTLHGMLFKPNRSDYYYEDIHKKERIVLHFTAGNVRSDIITLTRQGRHVSVPFVIARDGTIYQLFPSQYWSGHLGAGVGNSGTRNAQDKATIGIELSNYGYLVAREGNLETIYSRLKDPQTGKTGPVDLYAPLTNPAAYTKTDAPFREQSYYAAYTPEQLDSLIILLRYLTRKYDIPRQFLPPDKRFTTTQEVVNFKGIVSHVNYRPGGKWDIGPAFDWATVIEQVQADTYTPATDKTIARSLSPALTSEEEIEAQFPGSRQITLSEEEATDNEGYNPNDYEEKPVLEATATPNVYALLVGINRYARVRPLHGCLNDVAAMKKYLERSTSFAAHIQELTDEAATRTGIAEGFRNFLSQAGQDDTVLFYYSGHGTQEQAAPLWDETDVALECLVCYDGGTTKASEFLLTDKELRFLIHELSEKTQAHIVTIFDCCHSGDNTRNGGITDASYADRHERRITDKTGRPFPMRSWEEFLFHDTLSESFVKGKKPADFLPQGVHVQMAACESDQVALEVAREGVFTKALLKMLTDSGGNISYNTLRSRIRQYMRVSYEQTPRVYLPLDAENMLKKGFLNRPVDPQKMRCEATKNNKQGWQLNVGAIHGVRSDSSITLYDPEDNRKTFTPRVRPGGIFVDYTLLDVAGLDSDTIYTAEIAGLLQQELVLELENHDGLLSEMTQLSNELLNQARGGFSFGGEKETKKGEKDSAQPQRADYTLHVRSGEMYLTRPGDPYRPLVRPLLYVQDEGKKDLTAVTETLQHVSRWHFIKNLENERPADGFPAQPLSIGLYRIQPDGSSTPIALANDTAELTYEKVGNDWKGTIQISITNTTPQDLYVCAAYLSKQFQCFLDFLPQRVQRLEAGKTFFLGPKSKDRINLKMGSVEREYNWPYTEEAIKFIVSTEAFEAEALTLEALPAPLVSTDRGKNPDTGPTRSLDMEDEPVEFSGWGTQTLNLVFRNPVYNVIPAPILKALLDWDETAYFAAGLYCEVEPDETGQPTRWKLKEGLVVPEEEKGLIDDFKLVLGNKIETRQRRKRYRNLKKDPNRLRIVAEGDSWFQYPIILQDTLDQLYKCYAICSFAEAGDTLANYLKEKEYLDAIGEEGARLFLVSGGGNDILGDEFKNFLRESPDPTDPTLRRYLKPQFDQALTQLTTLYEEMFTELLDRYEDLHILVHCYDYIIPVDTEATPKKKSWSGKHMIAHHIEPQTERERLIRYIVDEFASRLTQLTRQKKFKGQVRFVDTRGLVNRTSWYDEIHPTDEGYALVADKFFQEIEKIRAQKKKNINKLVKPGNTLTYEQLNDVVTYNRSGIDPLNIGKYLIEATDLDELLKINLPSIQYRIRQEYGTRQLKVEPIWEPETAAPIMEAETAPPAPPPPAPVEIIDGQEATSPFRAGQLDYEIPDVMQLNQPVLCTIRLAGTEVALEAIRISPESTHAAIEITGEMSVRLIDPSNGSHFSLVPLSSERQAISQGDFTEWKISVTPLKAGTFPLFLRISAHFDGKTQDVGLLEKSIRINGDPAKSLEEIARQIQKKIVFLAADSRSGLLLGKESNKIREELLMSTHRDSFLYTTLFEVTGFDFSRTLLREKPTIVHFSGHGSSKGIFLVNEQEVPQLAPTDALKKLFGILQKILKIECVILNACFSRTQAEVVAQSIPVVVGTQSKIGDTEAINFSIGFYQGLGEGLLYEDAFELGRVQVSFNSDDEDAEEVLVLLKKSV